jgi:hypothetical protein
MLNHRLQVLLDEERWVRLNHKASETKQSVGALVRDAIDRAYPADDDVVRAAAQHLLAMEPMPVDDWPVMKEWINEMYEPRA